MECCALCGYRCGAAVGLRLKRSRVRLLTCEQQRLYAPGLLMYILDDMHIPWGKASIRIGTACQA